MSLDWDLTKIKNRQETCWITGINDDGKSDRVFNPITNGLIWYTLALGMGEITEKNCEEFYRRMVMHDKMSGTLLQKGGAPAYISFAEIKQHIGLHTNVWPKETDIQFFKKMMKNVKIPKDENNG